MLYLASDHAGFELKQAIAKFLTQSEIKYEDLGAFEFDHTDDYPDFIIPAAQKVAEKPHENKAIVLGGSGQGEAIAANKVKGIRAALYYGGPLDIIKLSKTHNNANVLSLGARFLSKDEALQAIALWLDTNFSNPEHHTRRLNKIVNFEQNT